MKSILLAHKPKETSAEDWVAHWENAAYTLQPLADTIKDLRSKLKTIREEDFSKDNHALLVHRLTKEQVYNEILSLLPEKVDKS